MPCLTHPQSNQEFISEHFISLSLFFYKINQNKNQIFGCGGSFPQLNSPLYLPWKEGKGSGCFCKTRSRTNLKVLQEDDQYWSLLHHQVLPLIAMTDSICTFCSLTWKYISLSLSNRELCCESWRRLKSTHQWTRSSNGFSLSAGVLRSPNSWWRQEAPSCTLKVFKTRQKYGKIQYAEYTQMQRTSWKLLKQSKNIKIQ